MQPDYLRRTGNTSDPNDVDATHDVAAGDYRHRDGHQSVVELALASGEVAAPVGISNCIPLSSNLRHHRFDRSRTADMQVARVARLAQACQDCISLTLAAIRQPAASRCGQQHVDSKAYFQQAQLEVGASTTRLAQLHASAPADRQVRGPMHLADQPVEYRSRDLCEPILWREAL